MAIYDLEEQEQLSQLKAWWEDYGNLVTGIVVAAAVVVVGWKGYQVYQQDQAEKAAAIYASLQQAVEKQDVGRARSAQGRLIESFASTPYAQMGALFSAPLQAKDDDERNRTVQIEWLVQHGNDPFLRTAARLRLAAILSDQKKYDDALVQLSPVPEGKLQARFEALRGDIFAEQGKSAEARAAYEAALAELSKQKPAAAAEMALASVIAVKKAALGEGA